MDLHESSHAFWWISPVCLRQVFAQINSRNRCTPWAFDANPKQMVLKNDDKHCQTLSVWLLIQMLAKGVTIMIKQYQRVFHDYKHTMLWIRHACDTNFQPTSIAKQRRVAQCWPPHHTSDAPAMDGDRGLRFKGGHWVLIDDFGDSNFNGKVLRMFWSHGQYFTYGERTGRFFPTRPVCHHISQLLTPQQDPWMDIAAPGSSNPNPRCSAGTCLSHSAISG